jgi:hypothetical protein
MNNDLLINRDYNEAILSCRNILFNSFPEEMKVTQNYAEFLI